MSMCVRIAAAKVERCPTAFPIATVRYHMQPEFSPIPDDPRRTAAPGDLPEDEPFVDQLDFDDDSWRDDYGDDNAIRD